MENPPYLEIERLTGRFGRGKGLGPISLFLREGAFHALVDASGESSSALLDMLAGFSPIAQGGIRLGGEEIGRRVPGRRGIMSLQRGLALFPHLDTRANIAFPMIQHGFGAGAIAARVHELGEELGLDAASLKRRAEALDPETALRVALARALAGEPRLLLLDEPLALLPPARRPALAAEIKRLHRRFGLTTILASSDLRLAMMLAESIDILEDGVSVQSGAAEEIYYRPAKASIARLAGAASLIPVTIAEIGERLRIESSHFEPASLDLAPERAAPNLLPGSGLLLIRPEQLRPALGIRRFDCTIDGSIAEVFHCGGHYMLQVTAAGLAAPIFADIPAPAPIPLEVGRKLALGWNRVDTFVIPAPAERSE